MEEKETRIKSQESKIKKTVSTIEKVFMVTWLLPIAIPSILVLDS